MSEYTCAECGGTFETGWSEEEATAEMERDFPGVAKESCAVICDPCYRRFNKWRAGLSPDEEEELRQESLRASTPSPETPA